MLDYSLKIAKATGSYQETSQQNIKDLYNDYSMVITEMPCLFPREVKEAPSYDWADEHGVDVYNASAAKFKEYDIEIAMGVKGSDSDCYTKITNLIKYFTSNGLVHAIYSDWVKDGKTGVIYKGISDPVWTKCSDSDVIVEFNVSFRVTKPQSEVSLTESPTTKLTVTC